MEILGDCVDCHACHGGHGPMGVMGRFMGEVLGGCEGSFTIPVSVSK